MEKMSQNDKNSVEELHAAIRGDVQGVGFRYFIVQRGLALGLRGYARNESDGSVEVLAQGTRPALERLLALLRQGPPGADVRKVETAWRAPTEHLSGFHTRW
jgi:acylphosphatase